jgi:hypothetical protein
MPIHEVVTESRLSIMVTISVAANRALAALPEERGVRSIATYRQGFLGRPANLIGPQQT